MLPKATADPRQRFPFIFYSSSVSVLALVLRVDVAQHSVPDETHVTHSIPPWGQRVCYKCWDAVDSLT